jgi:hypothetical protein
VYGFATLSVVLREVHESWIHEKMVLRTVFVLTKDEAGGYRNGIVGRFIICTVHQIETSRRD